MGKRLSAALMLLGALHAARAASGQQQNPARIENAHRQKQWVVSAPVPLPVDGVPKELWSSAAGDDPDRLLVCTFESDPLQARHVSAAYVSLDAGNTWMRTLYDDHSDWVSEPSCAASARHKAYFVAGVSDTSMGEPHHEAGSTEVYRSFDGGLHWQPAHGFPFLDWTSLAVRNANDPSTDELLVFGHRLADGFGDTGDGHWTKEVRPVVVSRDGGRSFWGPLYPPDDGESRETGAFPISTIVRSDGVVLVLFAEGSVSNAAERGLALYQLDENGYRKVANIPLRPTFDRIEALGSQMALDRKGIHAGRLYVSFPGLRNGREALGLASSDDTGRTWQARVLLPGDLSVRSERSDSGVAGVAVNSEGIIGIEWISADQCPRFLVSIDGGASVSESHGLGDCKDERTRRRLRAQAVASKMTGWNSPSAEARPDGRTDSPGFTLRVDTSGIWPLQIDADIRGRFHAFWPEVLPDGKISLMTSVVENGTPARRFSLKQAKDLTAHCTLRIVQGKFDARAGTFAIDALVENVSQVGIEYPTAIEIEKDLSDCGRVEYLNATGFTSERKALFRIAAPPDVSRLRPGESTLPVHLQIRVRGCEASQGSLFDRSLGTTRDGQHWFYALSASVRIFQTTGLK